VLLSQQLRLAKLNKERVLLPQQHRVAKLNKKIALLPQQLRLAWILFGICHGYTMFLFLFHLTDSLTNFSDNAM
jgi:hypothetical protein